MLLLLTVLVVVWIVVALAALALAVHASRADKAIDRGELAPVIKLHSAA